MLGTRDNHRDCAKIYVGMTSLTYYNGTVRYILNETMNFQIWPSAIVGAGSFWNYQSKLTPDSKEFAMMIDTQHKVSRYVRFIEQLIIVLT